MLAFASPIPSAFAGIDALRPRSAPRQSAEEQYFRNLAVQHERAAAFARQRLQEVRHRHRQQQHNLEAELRLQQQLAASLQARSPMRSSYQPHDTLGRALPEAPFQFGAGGGDVFSGYAELMPRCSQASVIEHQRRAEEQSILRALLEEQRRTEAERVAEIQRKRAEQAKAEHERLIRAQRVRAQMVEREQARRHLAARAAEEKKLKAFLEALVSAMNAEKEGIDFERKNAIRRSSVPIPTHVETPAPTRAPAPASSSPKAPTPAPRAASPSPSVSSDTSEASLHSISHLRDKYDSLRFSFEFPATLSFAPSTNSPASAPTLLFNPTNAPVHAYEHALTGLLTELDAVESFGDDHVRDVRRNLVRRVESELEALEEKKRETWRRQSGPVPVESVPVVVESAPVTVESTAPAPAESAAAATLAQSTPTPVLVPTLPTTIDPANPLAWLTARLAQPSESEDSEVKAVREGLATRLAGSVVESSEPQFVAAEVSESVRVESSGPTVVGQHEALVVEQSEGPVVDEPENIALESSEGTVAPRSPSPVAESQPESQPTIAESDEVIVVTGVHTSTEFASPASSPASVLVVEPEGLAETEPEVQSPTTITESVVAESESVSEPEVLAAPQPQPTAPESVKFVQVFPESDSDVDTDVDEDLVSELMDRSTGGADEFEML